MGKRWKVIYEEEFCIAAQTCANEVPEFWTMNEAKSKAILKGGKVKGERIFELETDNQKDVERNITAAMVCPINCIHVYEIDENGNEEKLV